MVLAVFTLCSTDGNFIEHSDMVLSDKSLTIEQVL